MSNTRRNQFNAEPIGDRDQDFAGTFPGSDTFHRADGDQSVVRHPSPQTTRNQWRNYWAPAGVLQADIDRETTEEDESEDPALTTIEGIRRTLEKQPQHTPILRDETGRAVLGSKAMTHEQTQDYLNSHPGSHIN